MRLAELKSKLGRLRRGLSRPGALVPYRKLLYLAQTNEPVSRRFGFDRGKPIDRYYLNGLAHHEVGQRHLDSKDPDYLIVIMVVSKKV